MQYRQLLFLFILMCGLTLPVKTFASLTYRGGELFIITTAPSTQASVTCKPIYGWNEPVAFYAHDGTIVQTLRPTMQSATTHSVVLPKNTVYLAHLKRSFGTTIQCPDSRFIFSPLQGETSIKPGKPIHFYFHVPPDTSEFTLAFTTIIGNRSDDGQLTVYTPDDTIVRVFNGSKKRNLLGLSSTNYNQYASSYAPDASKNPLAAQKLIIQQPKAGVWKVEAKGTELGFWLEGIPNLFGFDPTTLQSDIERINTKEPLEISYTVAKQPLSRIPFLGAVGNWDTTNQLFQKLRYQYGIDGDQIFLWPPKHADGNALNVPRTWILPQKNLHSLVILRGRADWMKKHPDGPAAGFADWAARAIHEFITTSGRSTSSFTVQVLSEPNLEMKLHEYLELFQAVAERFSSDPVLQHVALAGPALGAGEENDITDWSWVETLASRYSQFTKALTWNAYKISSPKDAPFFVEALMKTRSIADAIGQQTKLYIGGINRKGGLGAAELFTGSTAGLWWGAILAAVINSNTLDGIWYFHVIDQNSRAKGLFSVTNGGQIIPKPQAYVHQAFHEALQNADVFHFQSDISLFDGIITRKKDAKTISALLINKGWRYANIQLHKAGIAEITDITTVVTDGPLATAKGTILLVPPQSVVSIEAKPFRNKQ